MELALMLCLTGLLCLGGWLFYCLCNTSPASEEPVLVPFALLPVPDALPSTRAFIELHASQIAWMDAQLLRSMILLYEDGNRASEALCREMIRQYPFFSCMSLSEVQPLLSARLRQNATQDSIYM